MTFSVLNSYIFLKMAYKDLEDYGLVMLRGKISRKIFKKYNGLYGFCKQFPVNRANLSNFLNGKKDMNVSTLFTILRYLEYEVVNLDGESVPLTPKSYESGYFNFLKD